MVAVGLWTAGVPAVERFTMSGCPNCFNRGKMQCFQCDECVWCWTREGYGQCVPGNCVTGPTNPTECVAWQAAPDPDRDAQYYLPGWRGWWDWTLSPSARARLRNRYNFRQAVIR